MDRFIHIQPTTDAFWRAIILFGQNAASYKFALGSTLLDVARSGKGRATLQELAGPFADRICAHLKKADRQGTAGSSRFLDACRRFNSGEVGRDELVQTTARLGFVNVIDAFHVVGQTDTATRFFEDDRRGSGGIVLTDSLLDLASQEGAGDLDLELDARWGLVETAWNLGVAPTLLAVSYEETGGRLFVDAPDRRRVDVTSGRDALNGYQKGKCFYCFRNISLGPRSADAVDVDHFFPWALSEELGPQLNLDGVWNLVLSCQDCNRGSGGKSWRIPALRYLERLHHRNHFLIASHHPLRETLMRQTGPSEARRRQFLQEVDRQAVGLLAPRESDRWTAVGELPTAF